LKKDIMSTRKRKQDEELVALPSDESEEEEEYVSIHIWSYHCRTSLPRLQSASAQLQTPFPSWNWMQLDAPMLCHNLLAPACADGALGPENHLLTSGLHDRYEDSDGEDGGPASDDDDSEEDEEDAEDDDGPVEGMRDLKLPPLSISLFPSVDHQGNLRILLDSTN
jgi:hypothetical protein